MADTQHIVCPHCAATNRVAVARRAEAVCGACKTRLFDGAPHDTDEAGFNRHTRTGDVPANCPCQPDSQCRLSRAASTFSSCLSGAG